MSVVTEVGVRLALDQVVGGQGVLARAPCLLVFCAHPGRSAEVFGSRGEHLFCVQDATAACLYAHLAATNLGLASVWIGGLLVPEAVKQTLNLEERLWPVALLAIGARRPRDASTA